MFRDCKIPDVTFVSLENTQRYLTVFLSFFFPIYDFLAKFMELFFFSVCHVHLSRCWFHWHCSKWQFLTLSFAFPAKGFFLISLFKFCLPFSNYKWSFVESIENMMLTGFVLLQPNSLLHTMKHTHTHTQHHSKRGYTLFNCRLN